MAFPIKNNFMNDVSEILPLTVYQKSFVIMYCIKKVARRQHI